MWDAAAEAPMAAVLQNAAPAPSLHSYSMYTRAVQQQLFPEKATKELALFQPLEETMDDTVKCCARPAHRQERLPGETRISAPKAAPILQAEKGQADGLKAVFSAA
jgi:hypothetical protein